MGFLKRFGFVSALVTLSKLVLDAVAGVNNERRVNGSWVGVFLTSAVLLLSLLLPKVN